MNEPYIRLRLKGWRRIKYLVSPRYRRKVRFMEQFISTMVPEATLERELVRRMINGYSAFKVRWK